MSDDPLENPASELTWRRKLNAAEEAQLRSWLVSHPEAQAHYESEAALNEALDSLPNAPMPSNFTARVLRAVEAAPQREPTRSQGWLTQVLRWMPRTAIVGVTLGLALISYEHYRAAHRLQIARDAVVVSEAAPVPSPGVLQDFEVIRAMSQTPAADEELLKLLQ